MRLFFVRRDRRGGVMAFCAVALVVMMAMAGLVIDGGNLFLLRQRTQAAADSAALAAAGPFGGSSQAEQQRRAQFMFAMNAPGGKNQLLTTCTVNGTRTTVELETRYSPSLLAALGVRDFRIAARAIAENRAAVVQGAAAAPSSSFDPFSTGGSAGSLFGRDYLTFTGNARVDQYDSTQGSYAATKTNSGSVKTDGPFNSSGNGEITGSVTAAGAFTLSGNGHVGSAMVGGNVSMSGNAIVYGNMAANGTASYNGNARVEGNAATGQTNSFPSTNLPAINTTTVSVVNSNASIPNSIKGAGTPPSITMSGNAAATLPAGTYYINNLSLSGNSDLTIPAGVKLYVTGTISMSGNAKFVNTNPNNLQIYYTGTSLNWSGNAIFYGGIYAPNATTSLSGNADFFGGVVAKNLTMSGNGQIHVDRGLAGFVNVDPGSGNIAAGGGGTPTVSVPAHFGLIE